jgi:hypothetical protein
MFQRDGIPAALIAKIEQKARRRTKADFRGRVMTLPHTCYD